VCASTPLGAVTAAAGIIIRVQLMEIEREEERKREGGGYEGDGDEGD
jgi:hypothetical protein